MLTSATLPARSPRQEIFPFFQSGPEATPLTDEVERSLLLRHGTAYYYSDVNDGDVHDMCMKLEWTAAEACRINAIRGGILFDAQERAKLDRDLAGPATGGLEIVLNSPGGSIEAGFVLIDTMQRIKRRYGILTDIRVASQSSSMGTIILQHATGERIASPISIIHYHGPTYAIQGTEKDHEEGQKQLAIYKQLIVSAFASRNTSADEKYRQEKFWLAELYGPRKAKSNTFLSAPEALKAGLVDRVDAWT